MENPTEYKSASKLAGRKVNVFVNKDVKPEAIQQTLARIYEISGCTSCGLQGFDITLIGVDPAAGLDIKGISGINGVTFGH